MSQKRNLNISRSILIDNIQYTWTVCYILATNQFPGCKFQSVTVVPPVPPDARTWYYSVSVYCTTFRISGPYTNGTHCQQYLLQSKKNTRMFSFFNFLSVSFFSEELMDEQYIVFKKVGRLTGSQRQQKLFFVTKNVFVFLFYSGISLVENKC